MGQSARLSKGASAPYSGVLISDDHYRMMTVDIEHAERIKQEYSEFANQEVEREANGAAWLMGGFILGGLGTFLLMGGVK